MINTITNHLSLIEEDALLDSTIQFPGPLSSWAEPEGIFLTGATGFLGVYLLCELLQQTKAKIYCLVRAEDVNKAEARIKTQLACYGLSVEALTDRIIPICGDLSQPLLGLSKEAFSNLADLVDLIYHNGAEVNVVYSYTRLKASNVSGTLEVLRLAALGKTKPVHFVSTLAVFFSETYLGKTVLENTSVMIDSSLKGGYKQSKWVAEALIRQAQERGLPVVIYRAGRIWGDSQTGIMTQFNDLLSNVLQGCIHLKKIPTVDTQINLVPVDYVSQSIVKLSLQKTSLGQAFHLANPYSTSWNTLGEIMRSIGYPMAKVDYDQWVGAINEQAKSKLFIVLKHLLRSPIYLFSDKPQFDVTYTQMALLQSGVTCPLVDEKLMATYFEYFQQQNFIDKAGVLNEAMMSQ